MVIVQTTQVRVVAKAGKEMRVGEIVIESGEIGMELGRKDMGRMIGMFLPTSIKSPRISRVSRLRIRSLKSST